MGSGNTVLVATERPFRHRKGTNECAKTARPPTTPPDQRNGHADWHAGCTIRARATPALSRTTKNSQKSMASTPWIMLVSCDGCWNRRFVGHGKPTPLSNRTAESAETPRPPAPSQGQRNGHADWHTRWGICSRATTPFPATPKTRKNPWLMPHGFCLLRAMDSGSAVLVATERPPLPRKGTDSAHTVASSWEIMQRCEVALFVLGQLYSA